MRTRRLISLLIASSLVLCFTATAQDVGKKTVWNGVYTTAQAARGQAAYTANCSRCHGETLAGTANNALQGPDFMDRWREDNVESMFFFIRSAMPPNRNRNAPRTPLADDLYLDVISYVMQANGFPPGPQELKEGLRDIQIEGKDGPRPLPTGALAAVVGCMTRDGTSWSLTQATDPIRTRTSEMTTDDELRTLQAKPAGEFTFRLQNFGYLGGDFKPEDHAGQKMVTKGTLVRQLGAERISVTSMTMLAATCK